MPKPPTDKPAGHTTEIVIDYANIQSALHGGCGAGCTAKSELVLFSEGRCILSESLGKVFRAVNSRDDLVAALEEAEKGLSLVKQFLDDLGKSNPGWIGKLALQRYDIMNKAFIAVERTPAKARAVLAKARGGV